MLRMLPAIAWFVSLCSLALLDARRDAVRIVEEWSKAFTDSNVDAVVNLYAPDALFLGTGSRSVGLSSNAIRKYFEQALRTNTPRTAEIATQSTMVLSASVVIVAGIDTMTETRDGRQFSTNGRVTFVIAKRGAEWRIVHFHRSAMPN